MTSGLNCDSEKIETVLSLFLRTSILVFFVDVFHTHVVIATISSSVPFRMLLIFRTVTELTMSFPSL